MAVTRQNRFQSLFSLAITIILLVSCKEGTPESISASEAKTNSTEFGVSRPRIVALGDSLTVGLGLRSDEAYPSILQKLVTEAGYELDVISAGVSGDTSAGGLRRLGWALAGDVRFLIVALGANDGLRGLPVMQMRENLSKVIERAMESGVAVLLAGMEAPPNFGTLYTEQFREVFSGLADEYDIAFAPFLLTDVAGNPDLNQSDGIHPNTEGAEVIAEYLWQTLQPMLEANRINEGY